MQPISRLSRDEARCLQGVLFDLDDTLLDHGALTEPAYAALFRLRKSGLLLLPVTGRPATWGCVLVRHWPILAAVTETGAIAVHREGRTVRLLDPVDAMERRRRRECVLGLARELMQRYPMLRSADEYDARISDFAFDIGEREAVPEAVVGGAVELAHQQGFRTSVSSVNLHVTLDGDDKASGSVRVLRELLGTDPTAARHRFAYVGDSANDATCFAAFHTSIAVRNWSGRPTIVPRFITELERGAGFAEAARIIVEARHQA